MKKLLLFATFSICFLISVQAGYIIRSINIPVAPEYLLNFTVTVNAYDEPVSAGSMTHPITGVNCIFFVDTVPNIDASLFPILLNNENLPIQVRDLHYIANSNTYVLCGSRGEGVHARGFIAIVDGDINVMDFYEYEDVSVFYSIWAEELPSPYPVDYYACGVKESYGIICSVDRTTMDFNNFASTIKVTDWENHKIILTKNKEEKLHFVVSGRNTTCDVVGFTIFDPQFNFIDTYAWKQRTERESHCVVTEYLRDNYDVLLASSYQNVVTLFHVASPSLFPTTISAYHYSFVLPNNIFYVQDIGITTFYDIYRERVSVVGYTVPNAYPSQHEAWYGFVSPLSVNNPMNNVNYFDASIGDKYEHYKIRFAPNLMFTGGYFQSDNSTGVLFGTPRQIAEDCDIRYTSLNPDIEHISLHHFGYSQPSGLQPDYDFSFSVSYSMNYYECSPFKGGSAPEFAMTPPEKESEITTFYDRISVKDTPINTFYQIYSITGQLIQTGTTNPEISTAQLTKGMYILRLETGKAFKFVK